MDKRCVIAREALDWLLLAIPEGEGKYLSYRAPLQAARDSLHEMVGILRQEEHDALVRISSPCPCGTCDVEKREKRTVEDIAIRCIIQDDEELEEAEAKADEENQVVEPPAIGADAGAALHSAAQPIAVGAGAGAAAAELELRRRVAIGHCE
jgi:hypothetical protein